MAYAGSRLTHLSATGLSHKNVNPLSSSYDYGYDVVGHTVTVTTNNGSRQPIYTALGQPQNVGGLPVSGLWTYDGDSNGNILGECGKNSSYTWAVRRRCPSTAPGILFCNVYREEVRPSCSHPHARP